MDRVTDVTFSLTVYCISNTFHQCLTTHVCFITQSGDSPLMEAARRDRTEVVSLLVKAGAALDLQNMVNMWH